MSARSPSPRRSRTPPRRSASPLRTATSSDAPYTSSSSGYGQDQPQGKRVFVGGLSLDTRADDVEHAFAKYNPIKCDLKNGYGFLEFSNTDDAEDAIKAMDGTKLDGRKIQVEMAKGKVRQSEGFRGPSRVGPRPNNWRVEVEGLDSRISWQDLKDFGRDGGTLRVAYTDVKTDSRGERIGYIEGRITLGVMKRAGVWTWTIIVAGDEAAFFLVLCWMCALDGLDWTGSHWSVYFRSWSWN